MSKTWFTADTHFGHANIIKYCNRPFATVEEMDAEIIRRWNETISPRDVVYHLGDFAHHRTNPADILNQLKGTKFLIAGNHDGSKVLNCQQWAGVRDYLELKIQSDGTSAVLFHYAMRVWNGSFNKSAIHLYGHSHGRQEADAVPGSLDVGVDCWDFRPVSIKQIKERLASRALSPEGIVT